MEDYKILAYEFFKVKNEFMFGDLSTEKPHPKTTNLSEISKQDLLKAIGILKDVDQNIFRVLRSKIQEISKMGESIDRVISEGGRVFFCGCGSTGRLSLGLEVLCREAFKKDSFIGFMAGGDTALIKAIEAFEDHPEFAKRQMDQLGFTVGDLLIASTEGGETPFVIGATEYALKVSKENPYFLYCNPDEVLISKVQRSKRIIENGQIKKINLTVGEMAISGSTRMQASTILMYAIGLALFEKSDEQNLLKRVDRFHFFVKKLDFSFLKELIELESSAYTEGDFSIYKTDNFGITILTDTTERSPTFSLLPFENYLEEEDPSLTYLQIIGAKNFSDAWRKILLRDPRPLNWNEFPQTFEERLKGFNFGVENKNLRAKRTGGKQIEINILKSNNCINFSCGNYQGGFDVLDLQVLEQTILLKMLLNILSTLVMGRVGRYEGNLMTYVKPSCNKLIDRSIRYVAHLLKRDKIESYTYEEIGEKLFSLMGEIGENEPIVLKTYNLIKGKRDDGSNH